MVEIIDMQLVETTGIFECSCEGDRPSSMFRTKANESINRENIANFGIKTECQIAKLRDL